MLLTETVKIKVWGFTPKFLPHSGYVPFFTNATSNKISINLKVPSDEVIQAQPIIHLAMWLESFGLKVLFDDAIMNSSNSLEYQPCWPLWLCNMFMILCSFYLKWLATKYAHWKASVSKYQCMWISNIAASSRGLKHLRSQDPLLSLLLWCLSSHKWQYAHNRLRCIRKGSVQHSSCYLE